MKLLSCANCPCAAETHAGGGQVEGGRCKREDCRRFEPYRGRCPGFVRVAEFVVEAPPAPTPAKGGQGGEAPRSRVNLTPWERDETSPSLDPPTHAAYLRLLREASLSGVDAGEIEKCVKGLLEAVEFEGRVDAQGEPKGICRVDKRCDDVRFCPTGSAREVGRQVKAIRTVIEAILRRNPSPFGDVVCRTVFTTPPTVGTSWQRALDGAYGYLLAPKMPALPSKG